MSLLRKSELQGRRSGISGEAGKHAAGYAAVGAGTGEGTEEKLKKKQKFVIKLLILLAALAAILAVIVFRVRYIEPRDARADYLWEKENFPILDRLYQEKDLEALMDFYEQAVEENRTIDRWEHSGIFRWLMSCRDAREYLALEQSGETLNEYQQALLLDDYWMMRGLDYSEVILTEKDREYIRPYVEATLNSLADRYTFTAEEEKNSRIVCEIITVIPDMRIARNTLRSITNRKGS